MYRKYGNKKTVVDGITFDSKTEAEYYVFLKAKVDSGDISNLRMQVPYTLLPAVVKDVEVQLKTKTKTVSKTIQKPVRYLADFVYIDNATGKEIVVDVKGMKTQAYKLKKKMMLALLGIEITEVFSVPKSRKIKKRTI